MMHLPGAGASNIIESKSTNVLSNSSTDSARWSDSPPLPTITPPRSRQTGSVPQKPTGGNSVIESSGITLTNPPQSSSLLDQQPSLDLNYNHKQTLTNAPQSYSLLGHQPSTDLKYNIDSVKHKQTLVQIFPPCSGQPGTNSLPVDITASSYAATDIQTPAQQNVPQAVNTSKSLGIPQTGVFEYIHKEPAKQQGNKFPQNTNIYAQPKSKQQSNGYMERVKAHPHNQQGNGMQLNVNYAAQKPRQRNDGYMEYLEAQPAGQQENQQRQVILQTGVFEYIHKEPAKQQGNKFPQNTNMYGLPKPIQQNNSYAAHVPTQNVTSVLPKPGEQDNTFALRKHLQFCEQVLTAHTQANKTEPVQSNSESKSTNACAIKTANCGIQPKDGSGPPIPKLILSNQKTEKGERWRATVAEHPGLQQGNVPLSDHKATAPKAQPANTNTNEAVRYVEVQLPLGNAVFPEPVQSNSKTQPTGNPTNHVPIDTSPPRKIVNIKKEILSPAIRNMPSPVPAGALFSDQRKSAQAPKRLSNEDQLVVEHLVPIFSTLSRDVLQKSVMHQSNRKIPYSQDILLQRCIDDLLELRTFKLEDVRVLAQQMKKKTQNLDDSVILIDSDASQDEEEVKQVIVNPFKSKEDLVDELMSQVLQMIPDVDTEYLKSLIRLQPAGSDSKILTDVCNVLLENKYPKLKKESPPKPVEKEKIIDYFTDFGSLCFTNDYKLIKQSEVVLQNDFRKISVRDIRKVMTRFNYHYAASWKCIMDAVLKVVSNNTKGMSLPVTQIALGFDFKNIKEIPIEIKIGELCKRTVLAKVLPKGRMKLPLPQVINPELIQEIEFVIGHVRSQKENSDHLLAMTLNEEEYESSGQKIECGCCFGEVAFETMVQCYEGHLFCRDCLTSYAREAVFGQGKAQLGCMQDGCEATYPKSQLESLPENILSKYEDRLQEEAINLADIENLVRCPKCDYAAVMDPDENNKVFVCHNPECKIETCRFCKEEWSEHFGIPCKEMEKKDETKIRLDFEEKMTAAKIRTCHRCKAGFTKSDGCNKMTCRCGAKMCYICRKPNIDYNHFCRHARDPGHPCYQCKDCSLWTNPEEDDERAIKEIREKAAEARKAQGFDDDKLIGAPPEAKKLKTN